MGILVGAVASGMRIGRQRLMRRHRPGGRPTAIVLLAAVAALAGCGSTAHFKAPAAGHSNVPATVEGGDGTDASAAPDNRPLTPAQLARIPHFNAPPSPHPISVPAGPSAGWYSAVKTDQPVAFITIDDGWVKSPQALPLFQAAHVPVTLFLEINAIKSDVDYFKPLEKAGAVIEAHTITHQELKGKSYDVQKHEICGSADELAQDYGRRPVLFRPPFGDKDATTLRAVHDCGLKAAFFWKETTDKGIVRYQVGHAVQAGDIILMHFRPAFVDDFTAVLQAISQAGLTPALLEDYVSGPQ